MAYTLIRGRFHIHYPDSPRSGPQPDGDTIKFEPELPGLVQSLRRRGQGPGFNSRGYLNVRFEAIDALETHFQGTHQSLDLARAARDAMLRAAGYREVRFDDAEVTVSHAVPLTPTGYLLSRTLDPHGRIVAFVFSGKPSENDGAQVCLRPERARESINAQLLSSGLVYPSFYDTLPGDLRETLSAVSVAARNNALGIWARDVATQARPVVIRNSADAQAAVIFPKLFRRLASYFASGEDGLRNFLTWLREQAGDRDDQLVFPPMEFGNLHDIIQIDGDLIWLTRGSEEFVIVDSPETWRDSFEQPACMMQKPAEATAGDLLIVAALPNPLGKDQGSETVTLLNSRAESIDLAGYRLQDGANTSGIALRGVLPAGDTMRVMLDTKIRLSNQGDTIQLVAPGQVVIDQVSYTANQAAEGRSIAFGRD